VDIISWNFHRGIVVSFEKLSFKGIHVIHKYLNITLLNNNQIPLGSYLMFVIIQIPCTHFLSNKQYCL